MRRSQSPVMLLFSLSLLATSVAGPAAAEWPQWRGPNRDDVSTEENLLQSWPENGPKRIWLFENCGVGYSGPAVVGDRLYTLGARDNTELLLALDANSGKELWAAPIGDMLENNWGNGPRGTPTVDGNYIFALGAQGNLVCVQAADGKVVWTKSMKDLGGEIPVWGFAESPVVYEETVLCTPGGPDGAIAALDKQTGEVKWQTKELTSGAHYASIVAAQRAAGPECVQLLPDQIVGFDPTSGEVHWTSSWPGKVAVIPTPIVKDQYVYVTSGYGVGCKAIEIGDDRQVKELYDNNVMKNHHGGVILVGDHVYGHSDPQGWVCQDLKTGEEVWREREALKKGAIAYADGRFYCLGEDDGEVVLIEASTEGWKEHGRFKLTPQTDQRKEAGKIWTHPVICDGKLYLRDQNLLFCFDVSDQGENAAAAGN